MRRDALTARDRRALIAGGAVVASALLWSFGARPYLAMVAELRARVEAERALLQRERALVARAGDYAALFDEGAKRLVEIAPRLLPGNDDAVGGAALARYVREHAGAAGVLLVRVAPLEAEEQGGLADVGLHVVAESDLEGLLTMLTTLAHGGKLVRVDGLRIDASRGAPLGGPEVLSAEFTVRGLAFRGSASAGAAGGEDANGLNGRGARGR
ncbi:MAG TPA: type II secretion system protein GspM [Longimicrobiales bacterium]